MKYGLYQYGQRETLLNKQCSSLATFSSLFHCSRSLVFPSPFHLLFSHCPQEYAMSNDFISKREGKKQPYFPKQPSGRTALNVSIHLHPISHSGLCSAVATSLRIDHTRRSWNILTGPMSSLPPNSLRDWFHFAIQHIPPPRSLRIIHPLTAVICYSYFLCSGKWSFRLSLELKWNRSYIVLMVLPFSSSCLAAFTVAIFSPGRKWNTVKSNGTMYKTDCVLLFGWSFYSLFSCWKPGGRKWQKESCRLVLNVFI